MEYLRGDAMEKATLVAVIGEVDDPIVLPFHITVIMSDFDGNGLWSCAEEMLYVIGVDGESDLLLSHSMRPSDILARPNDISD